MCLRLGIIMSRKARSKEPGASLLVSTLQQRGVKLVGIDFDQTLISIHSGGVWKDSVEKLAEYVRPCIQALIEQCLHKDMRVCIVTYFMQPWVIKELMKKLFKKDSVRILVQANTPEFRQKHHHDFLGKEAHLSAIVTELYNKHHLKIRPDEIILFDDDKENTDVAIRFGHLAFLVQADISEETFEQLAASLSKSESRKSLGM